MNKLAKICLPVLAGLFVLFIAAKIDSYWHYSEEDASYPNIWIVAIPFCAVIGFLIEWIVILPLWNIIILNYKHVLLSAIGIAFIFCVLSGSFFGYIFWHKHFGLHDLLLSFSIMTGIQMLYWIGNILTLYYIDRDNIPTQIK